MLVVTALEEDAEVKERRPVVLILKSEAPEDDATLNGLRVEVPCTLKVYVEEVALIPSTVPLSKSEEVASAVGEIKRAMYPACPPVTPEPLLSPSVEVATHSVEVPVDQSTCPRVPEAGYRDWETDRKSVV